jgi:Tfp pilus assembly PilM family ATPase
MFDKTLIGLDIGSNCIKMVETKTTKGQKFITTYGLARHDIDLEGYWDSTKLRKLSRIINDIYKTGNFSGIKAMIGATSKNVFVTTMDFEAHWDKKAIQNEIEKQAKYILPFSPDEMRLSWSIINDDPRIKAYTGKQRIIINALPDFVLENSRNLLEHVNLDGVGLENQTISQIRSTLNNDTGNTVLVDIGAVHTTFSIIVDGVLRSSSHVTTGGNKVSGDLSSQLGMDFLVAENFKKDLSLVNLYVLPKPIYDQLAIIKSELELFIESNKKIAQTPNKIIFTGGGVHIAGFLEFFKNFPSPVFISDPIRNVIIDEEHRVYIMPMINQLSTAIGLSIREES